MPRLWPDPRDSDRESPLWRWLLLASLAIIAAGEIYSRIGS